MDGGAVWNTNLMSAIDKCMEIVDDPSKIVMDIIICSAGKIENWDATGNAISNYMRYRSIKSYYSELNDVI